MLEPVGKGTTVQGILALELEHLRQDESPGTRDLESALPQKQPGFKGVVFDAAGGPQDLEGPAFQEGVGAWPRDEPPDTVADAVRAQRPVDETVLLAQGA